jgi:hypothetical protein
MEPEVREVVEKPKKLTKPRIAPNQIRIAQNQQEKSA